MTVDKDVLGFVFFLGGLGCVGLFLWIAYLHEQLGVARILIDVAHRRLKELELHTGKHKPEDY